MDPKNDLMFDRPFWPFIITRGICPHCFLRRGGVPKKEWEPILTSEKGFQVLQTHLDLLHQEVSCSVLDILQPFQLTLFRDKIVLLNEFSLSSTFPPSVLSPVLTWTVSVWVPQSCEKRRGQAQLNYGSPGVEAGPEDCPAGQQERQQGNWTRGHWSELAKPPRSSKWKGEEARMIWSGLVVKSGAHLKNRIRWYIGAKGFTWLVYKLFQFLEKVS